ncbi:MAG TPA: hypothetical protein VML54_07565, partial [Candidatus Limnocylindrales bacterium]|nr:hypothetical protein [Candidatus Limnocylindrales bacterium]
GERAPGLMSTNGASSREDARRLEGEIAKIREDLGRLVAELDRRRHELMDVKLQVRRHPREIGVAAATIVGATVGLVWLANSRARRRRRYADSLGDALTRIMAERERGAPKPTGPGKIKEAATAAVAAVMGEALTRGLARMMGRGKQASPPPTRRSLWRRSA